MPQENRNDKRPGPQAKTELGKKLQRQMDRENRKPGKKGYEAPEQLEIFKKKKSNSEKHPTSNQRYGKKNIDI